MHLTMLMQEIWSEVVATLKSQYGGLTGGSDGVERQRLAFIQQWSSSPTLESMDVQNFETMISNNVLKSSPINLLTKVGHDNEIYGEVQARIECHSQNSHKSLDDNEIYS